MSTRILFVDDNEDYREITCNMLTKSNYIVTPASNGAQGLEIFKKRQFDLIITDIYMPIMDGNQFISELAKFSDLPPIIALSSSISDIMPNSVITVTGVKPMSMNNFRLLISQALK